MFGRQLYRGVTRILVLCSALAAWSGCRSDEPRTQVMLIIDADTAARERGATLEVLVESRDALDNKEGQPASYPFEMSAPDAPQWPLSMAIIPRGGDARRGYHITAVLTDVDGKQIAVLRARSGFIAGQTRELRLYFTVECLDTASLRCEELQTCSFGDCVSGLRDPRDLSDLSSDSAADGGTSSSRTDPSSAGSGGPKPGDTAKPGNSADGGMSSSPGPESGNCGDGTRDADERCDTGIPSGQPGACPSDCTLSEMCGAAQLEGSGCQAECKVYAVSAFQSGDMCCPTGADANSDGDCMAMCGNGIVEGEELCDGNCPSCDAIACWRPVSQGDPAMCNFQCTMEPIADCIAGDGCCPDGCSSATDSDCSATCGNGVVDPGELCEPNSATPCPTVCENNGCMRGVFTGSEANCNRACMPVAITTPIHGDGCCPPGATANNDRDCSPTCGNRIVERGESCDGTCPTAATCNDNAPCTVDAVTGSASDCTARCTNVLNLVPVNGDKCCPATGNANIDNDCTPQCGNLVKEAGEKCDGDCPTGARSCDDNMACTEDFVQGMRCTRECAHRLKGASGTMKDGCCPTGMMAPADADCPGCGNGMTEINLGEKCDGNCPASCPDTDPSPCVSFELTGTGCNVECRQVTITARVNDDKCCPAGASSANDNDCTPTCQPGPTECAARECMTGELRGMPGACDAECVYTPITVPANGDSCCPQDANANNDNDCTPSCGNRVPEAGEDCDGNCPACESSDRCIAATSEPGSDACHPGRCMMSPVDPAGVCCPAGSTFEQSGDRDCPGCGNGTVDSGEDCDEVSSTCVNCRTVVVMQPDAGGP
jgi:hypothetical protein